MPRILSRGGHAERALENVAILADSLDATVEVTANDLVLSAESFRSIAGFAGLHVAVETILST